MEKRSDPHEITLERLQSALASFGLTDQGPWDSLDVASVVAIVEHQFGINLEGRINPNRVEDATDLLPYLVDAGESNALRLRIDMQQNSNHGPTDRDRRQLEYRLGLAMPHAHIAVARHGSLVSAVASGQSPADVGIGREWEEVLGGTATSNQPHDVLPLSLLVAADIAEHTYSAHEASVVETVEGLVGEFIRSNGGVLARDASPLISVSELIDLGYYDAHPEQVYQLSADVALLPAACLGAYSALKQDRAWMMSFRASVFRRERYYSADRGRLPSFGIREILWRTKPTASERVAAQVATLLEKITLELGLDSDWVAADDPFFLDGTQSGSAKQELVVKTPHGRLAIASVNQHGDHFTQRGYGIPGMVTGCAGIGIDRLFVALAERA